MKKYLTTLSVSLICLLAIFNIAHAWNNQGYGVAIVGLQAANGNPLTALVDPAGNLYADVSANTYSAYNNYDVSSSTPTLIGGSLASRRNVTCQNLGPNDEYCGFSNTVSTTNGIKLPANGGSLSLDIGNSITFYCLATTANQTSPNDTRCLEDE